MDSQSDEWYRELKEIEAKSHRILERCCRATLNGAVKTCEVEDPVLMNVYKPKLRHCPECGKELP